MADKRPGEYGYEDASFRAMGGEPGIKKLVDHFYDAMEENPRAREIREMHPADLGLARGPLVVARQADNVIVFIKCSTGRRHFLKAIQSKKFDTRCLC